MDRKFLTTTMILWCAIFCGNRQLAAQSFQTTDSQTTATDQLPVRIALLPKIETNNDVVQLKDIAQLSGGPYANRKRMSELDLSIEPDQPNRAITKNETVARLLLAGFQRSQFQIVGYESTLRAVLSTPPLKNMILASVAQHVSKSLKIDDSDVFVTVEQNQIDKIELSLVGAKTPNIVVLNHGDEIIGKKQVEFGAFVDDKLTQQFRLTVSTTVRIPIAITNRPIERGEILSEENIYVDKQNFTNWHSAKNLVNPDQWLGKVARRRLRSQERLRFTDISNPTPTKADMVVRARDRVTVVFNKGSLKITMSGATALKAGRIGDVIPVKNEKSKKTIYGRVTGRGQVEIGD